MPGQCVSGGWVMLAPGHQPSPSGHVDGQALGPVWALLLRQVFSGRSVALTEGGQVLPGCASASAFRGPGSQSRKFHPE